MKRLIKRFRQRFLILIYTTIFLYSGFQLSHVAFSYYSDRQTSALAQEIYYEAEQLESSPIMEELRIRPKFLPLVEINPDVVGWLTVDELNIDYPLVQSADNEYYLQRNFFQEDSKAGSIFMDFRNGVQELGRHTILYGHRMKDGSMFGQLHKLIDDKSTVIEGTFHFDTLYDSYEVSIISAYRTTTDFDYIQTDFQNDEEYEAFLHDIQAKSALGTEIELTASDLLLTLSTCDYILDHEEGRFVVHAKLTKVDKK